MEPSCSTSSRLIQCKEDATRADISEWLAEVVPAKGIVFRKEE